MASPPDGQPAPAGHDRLELFSTILLAIAAVATAWSSYQATRWNGEQAKASSQTNAIRIDAARAADLASADTEIDVATFIAWVDAHGQGDDDLADFFEDRFRPEFAPAFDAWIATDPFTSDDAPPTPFAMPEYRVEAKEDAADYDQQAEDSAATVRRNIQRSSNYVLAVVLFAVALFFGGMSTKLGSRQLRTLMLACGYVVLLSALVWVATSPVSLSV
jgi:hypothetical protein